MVAVGNVQKEALQLAEMLRTELPNIRLINHCGGGNFKNQLKKADKSTADFALILGEDEVAKGMLTLKFLREEKPQQTHTTPKAFVRGFYSHGGDARQ